jgi:hypothetical protein
MANERGLALPAVRLALERQRHLRVGQRQHAHRDPWAGCRWGALGRRPVERIGSRGVTIVSALGGPTASLAISFSPDRGMLAPPDRMAEEPGVNPRPKRTSCTS